MKSKLSVLDCDIEPNALLEVAKNADLNKVIIIGFMDVDEGDDLYVGASSLSVDQAITLLAIAHRKLVDSLIYSPDCAE